MLSIDKNQPLLAVILQCFNLGDDLCIGKGLAFRFLVGSSEAAVLAIVDAFVADVQGCKQDYPVSVDLFLKLAGACLDFLHKVSFGIDESSRLSQCEAFL